MKLSSALAATCLVCSIGPAQVFKISDVHQDRISWVNAYPSGVCTLEVAADPSGPWTPLLNSYTGELIATDRLANRVYKVAPDGQFTPIAGNGTISGGGDGFPALETGLAGVRAVWFLPSGGYLLGTQEGSQVWYVDPTGIIHLFVDGQLGAHGGDGEYFRSPGFKVSKVRSVTVDYQGNIIITESDFGFVRRISFLRLNP